MPVLDTQEKKALVVGVLIQIARKQQGIEWYDVKLDKTLADLGITNDEYRLRSFYKHIRTLLGDKSKTIHRADIAEYKLSVSDLLSFLLLEAGFISIAPEQAVWLMELEDFKKTRGQV